MASTWQIMNKRHLAYTLNWVTPVQGEYNNQGEHINQGEHTNLVKHTKVNTNHYHHIDLGDCNFMVNANPGDHT